MNRLKEENLLCRPPLGRWVVLAACLLCLWAERAAALGTPAGTTIANTAEISYTEGGNPAPLSTTAAYAFEVQEVIDATLTWQDASPVPVDSPQTGSTLTFLLTNTGNGPEDFQLVANPVLGGDQFDPLNTTVWVESNGTAGHQSDDSTYAGGGIGLDADENVLLYLVNDTPAGHISGDQGYVQLTASALTPGAAGQAPGTLLPAAGFNNVDALVGTTRAVGDDTGIHEVATITVSLTKTILSIVDAGGGSRPYPTARVTYRIGVDVAGIGTAEGLVVTDVIPADMTYVAGSLVVDGIPQTDGLDGDAGDVNGSVPGTVTVDLSDTAAPAAHTIEFSTTIN